MKTRVEHDADRFTWLILIVYLIITCIVISTSRQMDFARTQNGESGALVWMFEITSHLATAISAILVPVFINRFPISAENWLRRLPIYGLGIIIFSAIHILLMVAMRSLAYPLFESGTYHFGLLEIEPWIYEIRKDILTFFMILTLFLSARHIFQLRLEAKIAREDAKDTGRLSLTSGGRTIFLDAADVQYVKAAGNYVEVFTQSGMHLVRMTLSTMEKLLNTTGQHIRVHRSYIVNLRSIKTISPNGKGEVILILSINQKLPVGRKYKTKVTQMTSA